ncbi:MAG: glucose-6-phosphate dehydrogenase [Flavobacteriales bacterium]|jgi:glucose-6-phosphate 1-dehydrogenase|nr:glucose-6-phosphate dehydrogenase [Flavobacteriales bacterium]MDG1175615.1 glucose-6-phosphate dehydrogenase [Flavobacteriales bacterium]
MNKTLYKTNLVIFGGDGDLSYRKIFPAIYHRVKENQLSKETNIIVVSKNTSDVNSFFEELKKHLSIHISDIDESVLNQIKKMLYYLSIDLTDVEGYDSLKQVLSKNKMEQDVFYYSTPSTLFGIISKFLSENGMINKMSKVVLEKPLGSDLESFEQLNEEVRTYFKEKQIYRIDHYLGKETVQNLMVLRFANQIFELAWNAQNIDNVQITASESLGVGNRKGYYDKFGALKDMVQNHLLQLLCLVAMEPPSKLNADNVRDEKLKVLKALRPMDKDTVGKSTVKGQYTRGEIEDEHVQSYQEDIDTFDSTTETFVALRTYVDNWRWAGVPFYLRTGKRMKRRFSEIVINFKRVPHNVFPSGNKIDRNKLIIRLQPEEKIELVQMMKIPGPGGYRYKPSSLELDYSSSFDKRFPDAYERLLMDIIRGNQTLFMREDEVRDSWKWINSITKSWEETEQDLELYKAGTWGPGDEVLLPKHKWYQSKKDEES